MRSFLLNRWSNFIIVWYRIRIEALWSLVKRHVWQRNTVYTHQFISISHRLCIQYIPRNMHTVFALLCFVVVIHWLIFPYPSGLLHWHCGNLTIVPVPAKQPWWIWINTSCEFIMNDCITTTKQSTTKPCAYFLGYTVRFCCAVVCLVISAAVVHLGNFVRVGLLSPGHWWPGIFFFHKHGLT